MAESTGRPSVLVVDDEEPIRNALKKFLTQQQFEAYAAASGEEIVGFIASTEELSELA